MSRQPGAVAGSMLHVSGTARVLVCLVETRYTREHIEQMRDLLAERFPGMEFTFLSGVTGLLAYDDLGGVTS